MSLGVRWAACRRARNSGAGAAPARVITRFWMDWGLLLRGMAILGARNDTVPSIRSGIQQNSHGGVSLITKREVGLPPGREKTAAVDHSQPCTPSTTEWVEHVEGLLILPPMSITESQMFCPCEWKAGTQRKSLEKRLRCLRNRV